jgi:hypothetical protein
MKTAREILEKHTNWEYGISDEDCIISMEEYAEQFKQVEKPLNISDSDIFLAEREECLRHFKFDSIIETMENAKVINEFGAGFDEGAKWYRDQIKVSFRDELVKLLGTDNAWPLVNVMEKLVESTEILLHKKDYDRHGWEEVSHCVERGKEIIEYLKTKNQ